MIFFVEKKAFLAYILYTYIYIVYGGRYAIKYKK